MLSSWHVLSFLLIFALASFVTPYSAHTHNEAGFADIAEKLLPTVVNISTTQEIKNTPTPEQPMPFPPGSPFQDFFRDFLERFAPDRPRNAYSLGSGFVLDAKGHIVTNNHVVGEASEIEVILQDGKRFKAELVGRDEKTDLALLKIETETPLPHVQWGKSSKSRVGNWVMAIGNPFGLGGTVTAGIISSLGRDINSGPYDNYIQTDASINRGNSGGPLFNTRGEVIGINTAIFTPTGASVGIGFAIPSDLAKWVLDQLLRYGKTTRGWLGVRIQAVTDEIAESLGMPKVKGALVAMVTEGQPAALAGLRAGDVILNFDNKNIKDVRQLQRMVAETSVDKNINIIIWRDGKSRKLTVKVGHLEKYEQNVKADVGASPPINSGIAIDPLGIRLAQLDDALRQRFELQPSDEGVIIIDIAKNSVAFERGLQPGDIIVETGQKPVSSPQDVVDYVKQTIDKGTKFALLLIRRRGDLRFVTLSLEGDS